MSNSNSNYYRANEDLHFKLTSPEEERALFTRAKNGEVEARDFLIRNHLLFAARFARRANRGRLPDDEVISAVNSALMNAIDRFDPAWGNRFTRYLTPFLRGAIAGLWKERNVVTPSSHSEKFPSFTHLAEENHDDAGDCRKMQKHIAELSAATDELVMEKEDLKLGLALLKKCRVRLTSAEKELLRLIYDQGVSMADIARQRKVSRQAIHQTHGQIIEKLRASFKKGAQVNYHEREIEIVSREIDAALAKYKKPRTIWERVDDFICVSTLCMIVGGLLTGLTYGIYHIIRYGP